MIINDYSLFTNLYSWIKSSCTLSSVDFSSKSNFFDESSVNEYIDKASSTSTDKLTGYNYLYNYFYYLQEYIKTVDNNFSFNDMENVYKLERYIGSIDNIDIKVFIEWFFEEGLSNIISFMESFYTQNYLSEDMFNILKYYNYLIEDSIKNDPETILTFLTEGSSEPFIKLSNYIIKLDNIKKDEEKRIAYNIPDITFDLWNVAEEYISYEHLINNMESANRKQTSFCNYRRN